jgi:hypothetical protein
MSRTTGRAGRAAGLLTALALAAGCGQGPGTGEVRGTVTVDGQPAPPGSSITFVPADGKAPTAGALIENGKYTARVPVGPAKVQVRAPKTVAKPKAGKQEGPGAEGDLVEESLPAKYNDSTTLTYDVKPGTNTKDWDLKTR